MRTMGPSPRWIFVAFFSSALSACGAAVQPPPEGFFAELGAGLGGCGGDGCIASDEGAFEVDLAAGWAFAPWLGTDLRLSTLFGDVDFVLGGGEIVVSPLVGSPVELYVALGPGVGLGGSDYGGGDSAVRRSWSGFGVAGRIGANFPTSYGGWGFFTSRVVAFGGSVCTAGEEYGGYYDDVCSESRDVAPQFWMAGARASFFP